MTIKQKKALESNVGKGEKASNYYFLLLPYFFYPLKANTISLELRNLSSADAFSLEKPEILSSGKELNLYQTSKL